MHQVYLSIYPGMMFFSLVHLQYIYIYKYTESQMLMKVLIVDLHPKVFEHVDPHPHPNIKKNRTRNSFLLICP